jgi:LuxR family transcriptional regulator of csgAB operon
MRLTGQIKQKHVPLKSETVFCLVGEKKCKNELIASHLCNEFENECLIFNNINILLDNSTQNRFVLLDWPSKHLEKMIVELATYNAPKKTDNPVVLHSVPSKHKFSKKILSKGIHGLFYQHDTLKNFTKGITAVLNGELWFPRETMVRFMSNEIENVPSQTSIADKLSPRQVEILSMIAIGKTNKEISEELYISPNTVKNHLYAIFKKINVSNRIHASLWAAVNL